MARSRYRAVYLEPEIDAMLVERAEARGVSVNEWINLAVAYALSGERKIKVTTTNTKERTL